MHHAYVDIPRKGRFSILNFKSSSHSAENYMIFTIQCEIWMLTTTKESASMFIFRFSRTSKYWRTWHTFVRTSHNYHTSPNTQPIVSYFQSLFKFMKRLLLVTYSILMDRLFWICCRHALRFPICALCTLSLYI